MRISGQTDLDDPTIRLTNSEYFLLLLIIERTLKLVIVTKENSFSMDIIKSDSIWQHMKEKLNLQQTGFKFSIIFLSKSTKNNGISLSEKKIGFA